MDLYRPILKTAWRTAIRERRLWWYALFAGLLIGSGFGTAVAQVSGTDPAQGVVLRVLDLNVPSFSRIPLLWTQAVATGPGAAAALVALGVVILALLLTILWFAVVGANALVLAGEHVAHMRTIPRDLRGRAQERFWPTFGIHLIAKALTVALLTAWGEVLTVSAFTATRGSTIRGIAAFVITALLLTVVHIVTPYAIANATIDRRSALPALREAVALLRERWMISIEASLLFSAVNLLSIVVWLIGSVLVALPFLFLGSIAAANGMSAVLTTTIVVGVAALVAYFTLIAMCFTTFLTLSWTLLYLRLTGPGEEPEPWIMRATSRKPQAASRVSDRL